MTTTRSVCVPTDLLISSNELSGRSVAVHFCHFCGVSMHNSSSMSTMWIVLFPKGIIVFPLRISSFGIMLKCIEHRTDFCWFWKTFSFMLSGFLLWKTTAWWIMSSNVVYCSWQ